MKYKHCLASMTSAVLLLTGCHQIQNPAPAQDSSAQAMTEAHPPASETTPLSDIVRCDLIRLPDGISGCTMAERTAEGFRCIAYNKEHQQTYLRISDDMQTAEAYVLTPPEDPGDFSLSYQWFALEDSGIWSIALMESHGGLEPYDPESHGDSYDFDSWNAAKQERYLLCHYAENGTLLSAITADELEEVQTLDSGDLGNINHFDCVNGMLYLTLYDDRVVQIDKETAAVSVVSDLRREDTAFNRKTLCFDRDGKPVLLQEKVNHMAPDVPASINEAVISEFELASSHCGQTIYTTGENWDKTGFSVLKGSGEYRLFINTYSKLIGIRDNGTQEMLIDMDASELRTQIVSPNDTTPPYTDPDLFDLLIVPVDDTQFLALYEHYPECKTDAFCLTRKHESGIG